ncbi:SDR family oxidoreductase [Rhodobacteraceae bacterium]|nr:SDR family oxidoreductase [Paracoccaceae bacterium]
MNTGLKDRVILVTGASGGIGAATVRMLIKEEAKVIASGRNEDKLTELATETGCDVLPFDLASELSVKTALSEIEVYGIVNCGGWGGEIASPMETDLEVFDKVTSVNARGTLLVTKYASKGMIKGGLGGSIVNVSSQASLVGLAGHVSYASSKGAVDAMTRVSALELGKHNIRVNAVNPTVVMTPMSEWYWGREDIGGPLLEAMPLGRWATEEDCAAPIIFLLSDASAMISGVCLPIDGGFTAV